MSSVRRVGGRLWRESATLMIVSRNTCKKPNDVFDYKVLMLKRSPKSRFMPGNYVFPGGVIDKADFDENWMELYNKSFKTFGPDFSNILKIKGERPPIFQQSTASLGLPKEIAFRICAIRETFEESGILILKKLPSTSHEVKPFDGSISVKEDLSCQDITQWRSAVHKDASRFIELCKLLDSVPDVWSLTEWSNWLTPASSKIRFDTVFFICFCDNQPLAQQDDKETVHSQWKSPLEVMMDTISKKSAVAPPQVYTLLQLCRMNEWSKLKAFQEDRSQDGMRQILPIIIKTSDARMSLLPSDDMYPELLKHLAQETDGQYGVQNGIVPVQEYQKTYRELEQGIENFHRIIIKGNHELKVNCSIGNRLPIPLDLEEFMALCQEFQSKL